jgi:hypothetical protein
MGNWIDEVHKGERIIEAQIYNIENIAWLLDEIGNAKIANELLTICNDIGRSKYR